MVTLGKNAAGLPAFTRRAADQRARRHILPQALWIIGVALAIMVVLHLFFGTTLRRQGHAGGGHRPRGGAAVGINVGRMVMLSFALGAAVGAVGGLIMTPMTLTIYDAGTMLGLKGFAAAVAGGLGNTFGGIAGGLLLGPPRSASAAGSSPRSSRTCWPSFCCCSSCSSGRGGCFGRGESERV